MLPAPSRSGATRFVARPLPLRLVTVMALLAITVAALPWVASPARAQGARPADPSLNAPPPAPSPDRAAIALVPHEAQYDMRLISRASGSPVVNAHGTMTYRVTDTCDGWAMESRTKLAMYYSEGEPVLSDWTFISWESKQADRYRFRIRSERNGKVDRIIDGRAEMTPRGDSGGEAAGGTAHFTSPEEKTVGLGPAVLLPAQHTLAVLHAAAEGRAVFTVPMFDGSEPDGAMQATAVTTQAVPAGTPAELPDSDLLSGPSWRMVLSFFSPDETTTLPEYEVRLRYHSNGVAEEVIQDFGTMALRATLTKLVPITDGGC